MPHGAHGSAHKARGRFKYKKAPHGRSARMGDQTRRAGKNHK
ncbi:MAG TPA: hypothetical protein VFP35_03905 [Candidatus Saccharimonadales bacterium]|nr:hypothetical protein [Candidatus Saccharimonadales bacterium]